MTVEAARGLTMDPRTALAIVGGYAVTKETVGRILGPTADYLGDELRGWTEKRMNNVGRIFKKTEEKLGDRINEAGSVHPKVLKEILDDGSFAEDELTVEYFGGVLASSRTGVSRDDRGATFARMVSGLTTYQLRTHYYLYTVFRMFHVGEESTMMGLPRMRTFVAMPSYCRSMDFSEGENVRHIIGHSLNGLSSQDLIAPGWIEREHTFLKSDLRRETPLEGLVVAPSTRGMELYFWAHGRGDLWVDEFLDPDVEFPKMAEPLVLDGCVPTRDLYIET